MDELKLPEDLREELSQRLRELAQPYDLEALVRDGVLASSGGAWYKILDPKRLPEVVLKQADGVRQDKGGGVSLRVPKNGAKRAAKLYRDLTGEDPT